MPYVLLLYPETTVSCIIYYMCSTSVYSPTIAWPMFYSLNARTPYPSLLLI